MGLLNFLKGKSPEDIEKQADDLFAKGSFGPAKIEYEKAFSKFEKKPEGRGDFGLRISDKIVRAKEALARKHWKDAEELMVSDCLDDARELLGLALELTMDGRVKSEVEELLKDLSSRMKAREAQKYADAGEAYADEDPYENTAGWDDEDPGDIIEEEEYFESLLSVLPPKEQEAYRGYGRAFEIGYTALNQGRFDVAEEKLSLALKENSPEKTYIPLELAAGYLNLEDYARAKELLYRFLEDFPDSLRAYHVLCETLWAEEDFEEALNLLSNCPEEISHTSTIHLLRGETLVQAKKFREAEAVYQNYLASCGGKDDRVIRSLAGVYEALGETARARALYGELLNACKGCGRRADADLRRRFADTSFSLGEHTAKTLELYLELAGTDPFNKADYYEKVSTIYHTLGNDKESIRFKGFSERVRRNSPEKS